jgi:hypothetical protein
VVRADVLRDAARLAGDHVGLADVVEERRLAVVDVAHDGDHGRARHERLLVDRVGLVLAEVGAVLRLTHRLEAELRGDDLDLVEVEPLVDGDHQPRFLNANPTICVAGP